MISRKSLNGKIIIILLSVAAVSFTGCRQSPVLEQVVYQENEEPDKDNETQSTENDEDNDQEDEQLAPKTEVDDSNSKRDQTKQDALSGNGNSQVDKTYDSTYEKNAEANGTSSQNPTESTDSNGGLGTGDSEQNGGDGNLDDGDQSGTKLQPSDDENYKQIVDARGETVNIPENVDSVTAVGEIATIVEMLGGNNRLLASSGSFTGNSMARSAFSPQGFSDVKTWWDGDGSATISSGNFDALLAVKPDVCFEISGQDTFSSDQVAALEEAEIAYVVLPALTSVDNIKTAVRIVGDVMGDRSSAGGTNAPAIAQQYAAWADRIIGDVQGKGSAKTTLYISTWDESAYWELKNANGVWGAGYGAPIARKASDSSPLNDCMSIANLTNVARDNYYANPIQNSIWNSYISGGSGLFKYNLTQTVNDAGQALGNAAFPAIVVADSSIKTSIQNDIHWQVYGWVSDGASLKRGFDDGSGNIIRSTIEGDYEIYTNPSGVGSWTEGSVEAPLEAAWLSCKFQNGCSMDELRSMISDFYSTFYHTSADTGAILGE